MNTKLKIYKLERAEKALKILQVKKQGAVCQANSANSLHDKKVWIGVSNDISRIIDECEEYISQVKERLRIKF